MHLHNQQQVQAERLYAGKFLSMFRRGRWEYAHRENAAGAIAIVAQTPAGNVLLVEQFRPPIGANSIELPAGLMGDEPGNSAEAAVDAAHRELVEETGYAASEMVPIMSGPSSAGLTSEMITLLHAKGLRRGGEGGGVDHEEILVHEVPLKQAPAFLQAQEAAGKPVDFKVYAGLYFLLNAPAAEA